MLVCESSNVWLDEGRDVTTSLSIVMKGRKLMRLVSCW